MMFNKGKNRWKVYSDKLGDKDLFVRVDTSYAKKKYTHTLYIVIPYQYMPDKTLPNENELNNVYMMEETIEKSINQRGNNIAFVGCASFGGNSYLTYVTNEDIDWENYNICNNEKVLFGIYKNDKMGYYDKILYPSFIR